MPARGHGIADQGPEGDRLPFHQRQQHAQPREDLHKPPVAHMPVHPQFAMIHHRAGNAMRHGSVRHLHRIGNDQLVALQIDAENPAQRPFRQRGIGHIQPEGLQRPHGALTIAHRHPEGARRRQEGHRRIEQRRLPPLTHCAAAGAERFHVAGNGQRKTPRCDLTLENGAGPGHRQGIVQMARTAIVRHDMPPACARKALKALVDHSAGEACITVRR